MISLRELIGFASTSRPAWPTALSIWARWAASLLGNDLIQVTLERTEAENYDFAEQGLSVTAGDTAGIGFWQNKHGQALIAAGGSGLADWLTENFGNIFGNRLVGASGSRSPSSTKISSSSNSLGNRPVRRKSMPSSWR